MAFELGGAPVTVLRRIKQGQGVLRGNLDNGHGNVIDIDDEVVAESGGDRFRASFLRFALQISYKGKTHDFGDGGRAVIREHAVVLNQLG
jgi:hypothetical protein